MHIFEYMFILLSFIGKLPNYIVECVHQIRLYCNNDIYLIINDFESEYLIPLSRFNVIIVSYDNILDKDTKLLFDKYRNTFEYIPGLTGREELFMRSIERFYLAHNILNKYELKDCLFLEIDNLIYDDPNKWLDLLQRKPLTLMQALPKHLGSNLCYIKDKHSLDTFLKYANTYIESSLDFLCEMICFFHYKNTDNDDIQFLPILFGNHHIKEIYQDYELYDSIFDSLGHGTYLLGVDLYHKNNPGVTYDYYIQGKNYEYKWEADENGLKKPYIFDTIKNKWTLINNLHIHSKNLQAGLSKSIEC